MGLSEGVTQTIFFVAAILLATAVVVMTYGALQNVTGDLQAHAQVASQRLRSEVRIINDPAHVTTSPSLILYVKNVGVQALHPELWNVILDGTVKTSVTVDVLGTTDDTTVGEAQVAQLTVGSPGLSTGDHTARVVAETGVADDFVFAT